MKSLITTFPEYLKKSSVFLLLFLFAAGFASGQGGTVSPYSRFGLGDLQFGGFVNEIGMGGVSTAMRNPIHLNYSNPASYTSLRFTTFETAVKTQLVRFESQDVTGKSSSTSVSYIAFGVPLFKGKGGASFGLVPYSDIGYDVRDRVVVDPVGRVDYYFKGSGGLNRFYIGGAYTLFKNLSLGVNASYLFGTLQRIRMIEFADEKYAFNTQSISSTGIHDLYFNYGLQYVCRFKKDQQLTLGASGALTSNMHSSSDLLTVNYVLSSFGTTSNKDTVEIIFDQKGKTVLPLYYTVGLVYKKGEKWVAGIDYAYQNWSNFESFGSNDSLNDSYKLAAGIQLTPDYTGTMLKRMQYRIGGRYAQTYLMLKGKPINEYAVSAGFGIPIRMKFPPRIMPSINFAIEAGQRGTKSDNLLKEQYVRFHLGISISEEWFIARKFD